MLEEKNNIGIKYDDDKERYDLIVYEFIEQMAKVMTKGAYKYAPWNWITLDKARIVAALQRHNAAYMMKETIDMESQCSHLAHIACNAMMLYYKDLYGDISPNEVQNLD